MESIISQAFFQNWQRKGISLGVAIIVWIFVNQSITETKTVPNIPIKVINLPQDKTIGGSLPNGYLSTRLTLTLSGSKDVVKELEQGDLEVLLDASTADSDNWVIQVSKKNLVSLNPSLDLRHHINSVSHPEFVIKLSDLISDTVPIWVETPTGHPPHGYEFLDIWPERLSQTISGPKEAIQELKIKGLSLVINMDKITAYDLDRIKEAQQKNHGNEISYLIPEKWKKVPIPFRHNILQEINDPEARNLRINFLKQQLIPIGKEIPITVYYPIKYSETINPTTHSLEEGPLVKLKNGITIFTLPLYVKDVSRLFLDIIRENIEIVLVASPKNEREHLQWSIEVVDPKEMEDTYVAYVIAEQKEQGDQVSNLSKREEVLRKRFRDYMQKLAFYREDGEKLEIFPILKEHTITFSPIN
ncbi:putative uncharacterized protein [Waddlia chondrophila 2032/99]|uniref:Uncharacterized protein n=2 Tax=Waddlia chondrophila TaxID=71667 RepID=D6YVI8_WADCW|nr:hypothetical protein [Waddlia chondrophila]ADI38149.1 conserved hypothetical protein [Waddlia chondrophila WSU 86-1044]CCB91158.1 putative uncharacterized protein [Waddlia chondrophila 2032/99]